jgi:anti-sigma28 factor (negative regulator of flagellin synthesis)
MKITNTSIETVSPGGSGAVSGVQSSQAGASAKSGKADSVNLSNATQLVNLAKTASAERNTKVSNVAALVRSGQYSADTASVSQAVVAGHIQ